MRKSKKVQPTPLQKRFCDIILIMELTGKIEKRRAYELAGYRCRGETARVEAERTLRLPHVKKYLARARARNRRAVEKTQLKTVEDITREYEIMAFARPADYYHADGSPKSIKELTKAQRAALKSITIVEHQYKNKKGKEGKTVRTEYSLQPKKSSLDSLARIKGMMKPDMKDAAESFAQALHEAMKDEKVKE